MKNHHSERGTMFTSVRYRPGESPAVAESPVPERSVEQSQRAATTASTLPPQFYGGGFKPSPEHEAEGRIGAGKRE